MDEHLRKAKKFLAIAESKDAKREAYKAAANEIAAYKDETGVTWDSIALELRRGKSTLLAIDKWRRSGFEDETPFMEGGGMPQRAAASHTKATLRDAPMEQVEQIIASLPKERQQAIGAAAGHQYMKARQEYDDRERNLTPADKREREAAAERLTRPVRQAVAGFAALGIVGHLEQATEELRELTADGSLVPKVLRQIERATDVWVTELEFAKQMAGGDQ